MKNKYITFIGVLLIFICSIGVTVATHTINDYDIPSDWKNTNMETYDQQVQTDEQDLGNGTIAVTTNTTYFDNISYNLPGNPEPQWTLLNYTESEVTYKDSGNVDSNNFNYGFNEAFGNDNTPKLPESNINNVFNNSTNNTLNNETVNIINQKNTNNKINIVAYGLFEGNDVNKYGHAAVSILPAAPHHQNQSGNGTPNQNKGIPMQSTGIGITALGLASLGGLFALKRKFD